PCAVSSGSGWESNPPGVFADATPGLKPGAVTRSAYAPKVRSFSVDDPPGDFEPNREQRSSGGDVQRAQIVAAERDIGEHVFRNGDSADELAGRSDDVDSGWHLTGLVR